MNPRLKMYKYHFTRP